MTAEDQRLVPEGSYLPKSPKLPFPGVGVCGGGGGWIVLCTGEREQAKWDVNILCSLCRETQIPYVHLGDRRGGGGAGSHPNF